MKKSYLATAALSAFCVAPVFAQTAATPDYTLTGNVALASDYRFRGISQTNKKPAIQGGFDFTYGNFYVGNWNSNVDSDFYNRANIEMDFYGGYKGSYNDFTYDVGALYYYYPGSGDQGGLTIHNTEVYIGGGYGPFTLKYSHAVSNFFSAPNSKNSYYLDLGFAYDIYDGYMLGAHAGYQRLKGGAMLAEIDSTSTQKSVTDWKLGVSKEFKQFSGVTLGVAYIGTNRNLAGGVAGKNISGDTLVVSVGKTF
ncbi:MAG: hypothetical protein JWQ11_372 [Rhizobacter sp.]|nr:hypothetical protein [Rhizobacter sp.]